MHKKKMCLIIKNLLLTAFYLCLAVFMLTIVIQRLSGAPVPTVMNWGVAVVKTGSMEPSIPTGSLIFIQDTGSYEEGDIVTFLHRSNMAVTHRITDINGNMITTQGDANNAEDQPFPAEKIIGEVRLTIPRAGVILPPLLLVLTGLLVIAVLATNLLSKGKEQTEHA